MKSPYSIPTKIVNIALPVPIWERCIATGRRDYVTPQEAIRRFLIANIDVLSPMEAGGDPEPAESCP